MKSMTGYAARDAEGRRWEIRSVNGRGLDLRLRVPDVPAGIDPMVREMLGKVAARGNVTVSLRLGGGEAGAPALDPERLVGALDALAVVSEEAAARGVPVSPPSAAEVLGLRGVYETRDGAEAVTLDVLRAEFAALLEAFDADRAAEGARLHGVLRQQVEDISVLTDEAQALGPARAAHLEETCRAAFARLGGEVEDARIVQEIAALVVKGDVTEEIDRLRSHVAAARDLLDSAGPVGRRFDFLTQEFNREANTLCSKAQMAELTRIGLDLKTIIDRLREQVQNVE